MPDLRTYPERVRQRIQGAKIVTRLIKHINGEITLSPSQVASCRILLNKTLPDLKSIEVQASIETVSMDSLSDQQLMAIAAGGLNVVPLLPANELPNETLALKAPAEK